MLTTPFGEHPDEENILSEYPRPQMKRDSYINFNGRWDYAIVSGDSLPGSYDGTILVPFSPEAPLSGVNRTLSAGETLVYHRKLALPEGFLQNGWRLLLHFGAVDQSAVVYHNGNEVARHVGGYTAFTAELCGAADGDDIVVQVKDDTDAGSHSRGKQKSKRGGIWYTPQSGIWQTVWLEAVPRVYLTEIRLFPHPEEGEIEIVPESAEPSACVISFAGRDYPAQSGTSCRITVPDAECWTPENPKLYGFTVTLGDDRVESYFALRSFTVGTDGEGVKRLFLNGKPYFQNGLLDQGYWPDGLYTAPSDEAMIFDIQTAKDLGFNMLRKHIKVEPMRWYYHCDRLGMIVWQDIPNGGGKYNPAVISLPLITGIHLKDSHYRLFARTDAAGREEYRRELCEIVRQLRSVPSIALWTPFNEGWGQFDASQACAIINAEDGTRVIDHASGWHDQGIGETKSLHVYFKPYRFRKDKKNRAVILTEFGGYNWRVEGHGYNAVDFGYRRLPDRTAFRDAYRKLYEEQILPAIREGLSAAVYTQLTDVEDELNGLLTYDRRVLKPDAEEMRALNARLMKE